MKKSSLFLSLILFVSFKSFACYESSIMSPNPFMGNNEEIFKLSDGSLWKVMYEYEYLYEYYPDVVICPSKNILIIDGKSLNVMPLSTGPSYGSSNYFESQIDGESEGWSGDHSRAVDGNPNPYWKNKSCTHTQKRKNEWWMVDLGDYKYINKIVITNRKDCCSDRLKGAKVCISEKFDAKKDGKSLPKMGKFYSKKSWL